MPTFTAKVRRAVFDAHTATLSVEADSAAEASVLLEESEIHEFQDAPDYVFSDEYTHTFTECLIDGKPVDDFPSIGSQTYPVEGTLVHVDWRDAPPAPSQEKE